MSRAESDLFQWILLGSLAGTVVALLVGSLINALWLLLANAWLGVTRLDYGRAFKTVFLTNFVMLMIGIMYGYTVWYLLLAGGEPLRAKPVVLLLAD